LLLCISFVESKQFFPYAKSTEIPVQLSVDAARASQQFSECFGTGVNQLGTFYLPGSHKYFSLLLCLTISLVL
jgi:hypothetical protein